MEEAEENSFASSSETATCSSTPLCPCSCPVCVSPLSISLVPANCKTKTITSKTLPQHYQLFTSPWNCQTTNASSSLTFSFSAQTKIQLRTVSRPSCVQQQHTSVKKILKNLLVFCFSFLRFLTFGCKYFCDICNQWTATVNLYSCSCSFAVFLRNYGSMQSSARGPRPVLTSDVESLSGYPM